MVVIVFRLKVHDHNLFTWTQNVLDWDFHLTENGQACLHTYGEQQLSANYNFFHWKIRHWHVERTATLTDSFGIVCLFSCYLRGNPHHFQDYSSFSWQWSHLAVRKMILYGTAVGPSLSSVGQSFSPQPHQCQRYYSPVGRKHETGKSQCEETVSILLSVLSRQSYMNE